jgi:DNA-binding PadR family transcriptional regulator
MYGKAHGYQVRRELLTWSADRWANVQPGSVYHALKKMTREKLLEQVEAEPGDAGPDRVAYRITGEGETEFHSLLRQALSSGEDVPSETAAAVTLMTTLPRREVISLLRDKTSRLEAEQRGAGPLVEQNGEGDPPAQVRELDRAWQMQAETRRTWLRELIGRLEAGEYVMADDPGRSFGQPPE